MKLPIIILNVKTVIKGIVIIGITGAVAVAGIVFYAYTTVSRDIPEIARPADYQPPGVTQIVSSESGSEKVIAEFYKERRYLTPYEQIPKNLVNAFLSAEDSGFFEHQGINPLSILRAAFANFMAGQVVQGGSTITQQIAKSLYLTPEKNIVRKVKETFLAFQLEKNLKKEEILYLYLNQIYLGSGAYGVRAAARQYFQKDLKKLTLAEMALIAGLPTAPGKYSPLLNPKKAKERQLYVLKRMRENSYISENEQKTAGAEMVRIYSGDGTDRAHAPDLVEHIRRFLIQRFGEKALYEEAMTVTVPAAIRYYQFARDALENGLEEADQRKGYRGSIRNAPAEEWEKIKGDYKVSYAKEVIPYRLLTLDGVLDLDAAQKEFDPSFEKTMTKKRVQGLVTEVTAEAATVSVGVFELKIPLEQMKWAYAAGSAKSVPKLASDVTKIGDLIWVKDLSYSAKTGWTGSLTQEPQVQGAIYSVDVKTGQILAMVGGYSFQKSEFNRAVQAKRQMGSTFKPVIYASALERGYTPATIIVDSPVVFDDAENGKWKPENYEEKFYGDTLFRQALVNSRNIPTIKIVQDVKVSTVVQTAKRLGLEGPFQNDLSISLGSATTSVQELVHAFTAFPLLGKPFQSVLFEKILNRNGEVIATAKDATPSALTEVSVAALPDATQTPTPAPVVEVSSKLFLPPNADMRLDPRVAYVMTHLMKEVVQYGTAGRANALGRPVAGKTGTNQDFRDGWFIGYSPRVVTGVWVGYDDQHSMGPGETGATTALPIWVRYMQQALRSDPVDDFEMPEGITFSQIDPKTGKISTRPNALREAFIAGTEPGPETGDAAAVLGMPTPPPNEEDEFLKEDR